MCREAVRFGKVETRPPKLQKTGGFLERREINDEQVEQSLSCKNAPAQHVRSKHHKLAPLKSPRLLSGCQKARLMQAATKILEPGMQSRNRPRYTIIYMDPTTDAKKDEGTDATAVLMKSKELPQDSIFRTSMAYGHMIRDSQASIRKKETMGNKVGSSTFRFTGASSGSDNFTSPGTRIVHSQNEEDMNNTTMFPQAKFSTQNNQHESVSERKYHLRNEQHLCKSRPDETPISNLKGDNFRQNQPASVRHTAAFGSKVYSRKQDGRDSNEVIGRRIFMSADRSFDIHASRGSAVPVRDGQRLEVRRNTWKKNLAVKRTVDSSRIEQIGATNSNSSKEITGNGLMNRKKKSMWETKV